MKVIKKDFTKEEFDDQKIINAVNKSASRVMIALDNNDYSRIIDLVWDKIIENNMDDQEECTVDDLHNAVESALDDFNPKIAKSYRDYRNYKKDFIHMMDKVYANAQKIRYIGDKDNANTDSALVATKRSLIFNSLNKELYQKFFMTVDERQACKDGYIYIHDMSARLDTMNCFRRDTRFITELGVKSFYDFKDGDTIRVLTHKGNWKNAVVKSYGWQPINKVTLKRAAGKSKDIYCTENHRWILKDGTETTNLKVGDKLIAAPDITNYEWNNLTKLEKLLWCIGFGIADGSIIQDNNIPIMVIRLCGNKNEFAYRFEDVGYKVTYPKSLNGDGRIRMYDIHTKELPWMILNAENIKYLIDGLMSADGNKSSSDNYKYRGIQVTGDLNKYIYDLLNISGLYVSSIKDLTGEETNYGIRKQKTISYQTCSNQGDRTWFVENIKKDTLNPKSEVWCLEVEDDHSFILEGGIPTGNCCLFRVGEVMRGGFEMGNVWYNEPNTLDTAFDVMGDIILSTAAQQYGGFTVPEIDKILAPYAQKSYDKYMKEYICITNELYDADLEFDEIKLIFHSDKEISRLADKYATEKVKRDFEQGWQGIEYKLNTVGSSRGDYPFVTMTFGLDITKFGKMASITFLNVHKNGQGKKGFKRPVLFPKLVFLYDENIHGPGKINEDVFNAGIECSMKTMYPDWLSLSGDGYVPEMYKKYGSVVSPMGCRAFLSPWYEKGGMEPADDNDKAVFEGRFNLGAISLHLPMILAKSRQENKDFYEVLDYYLEMIRGLHKRTYDYIGEMKASVNPVAYCEGGFYGGNLNPDEKIKSILKPMTLSFGITALNELQELYNGKSIAEDGQFALNVMKYINNKLVEYKKEDGLLYAIYGTPAESLCGLQVEQFRKMYGIVEGVSDRSYVSNSFHCGVWEDITPIEKQNLENRFWNLFNGGKIQYCRYPISYNKEAVITLVRRAMKLGLYEGVNLALSYCEDCGYEQLDMDVCPKCGSSNITKVDRMNGYLGYTRVHGDTRYNKAKNDEIKDRISM